MHSKGLIHRDIKSGNILLGEPGSFEVDGVKSNHERVLKVADFGLSRIFPFPPKPMTKEISTLNWRAPEVMMDMDNLRYTHAVDMWSIGIVFHEMLTGKLLFTGQTELEVLLDIFRKKGRPMKSDAYFKRTPVLRLLWKKLPKTYASVADKWTYGFEELIDALTIIDPAKRPSCE